MSDKVIIALFIWVFVSPIFTILACLALRKLQDHLSDSDKNNAR